LFLFTRFCSTVLCSLTLLDILDFISLTFAQEEDEFLLLACDGIWDVMTNEDAVDFIHDQLKVRAFVHPILIFMSFFSFVGFFHLPGRPERQRSLFVGWCRAREDRRADAGPLPAQGQQGKSLAGHAHFIRLLSARPWPAGTSPIHSFERTENNQLTNSLCRTT
jgi:hypothetical protein